jgi:thymidylate kinase
MKRIIAFDGGDCLGKSTIIDKLSEDLIDKNFIPYVFHLSSPTDEYRSFFNETNFGKLDSRISNPFIQWEKFIQLFKDINIILKSCPRNIIILDRTPYSENIWAKFFNRKNIFTDTDLLTEFLKLFQNINNEILFINLNVENSILADRIIAREIDFKNYLNAYQLLFKNNIDDYNKVLIMIDYIKKEFIELIKLLNSFNIEVKIFDNNTPSDIQTILFELRSMIND